MTITLHRPTEDEWEQVRDLRLEALADTPIAYGEHLADARELDEAEWRMRARRATDPGSTQVVAILADGPDAGRWVATMGAFVSRGLPPYATSGVEDPDGTPRANLVGVFVSPSARGRDAGVADALLDAVVTWVRDEAGLDRLYLHVHEDNPRASRFYERRGFVFTGDAYDSVEHPGRELEMVSQM